MRKRCPRTNNSNGFSIAEILVAVAILGFISAVMVSLVSLGLKAQRQTNVDSTAHTIYRNIVTLLNADKSWKATLADSNDNPSLQCLISNAGCTSSTADAATLISSIQDQNGKPYYTYGPTQGFTNQGQVCTTFNGAIGQGNDQCPLHYDVSWWPVCGAAMNPCTDPTIHFKILPTYNPSPKSTIPFNQLNYGTADYIRGSEAFACNFVLDSTATYLTETCATVGIGTAKSDRAELTVTQPTSVGIFAQEWQRGTNYLDLDVAPNSVNGSAVTFQSNAPIMLTAQNDYRKNQLYLATNSRVAIGQIAYIPAPLTLSGIGDGLYGGTPEIFANADDHAGGGVGISNDGGFFDYNDGYVTYNGNYGLRVAGTNGPTSLGKLIVSGVEGIGTITPGYPLHIYTAANGPIAGFQSTTAGNTWISVVSGGNDAHFGFGSATQGAYLWSNNGRTYLGSDGKPTLLADDGAQKVGINTTTPMSALEVVPGGGGTVNALPGSFTGGIHTRDIALDNAVIVALNGVQTARIFNNTATGQADGRFTGALYARAFFYTSDERLKTNIEDLRDPLERVCSLRGVSFNWKSTGEKEMGFIAQEVKKTEPSLVSLNNADDKDSMLSVKYGNIVALVVEAIKKIKLMLFAQDQRILKLEAENQDLRARLERLELNQVMSGKSTPSGISH